MVYFSQFTNITTIDDVNKDITLFGLLDTFNITSELCDYCVHKCDKYTWSYLYNKIPSKFDKLEYYLKFCEFHPEIIINIKDEFKKKELYEKAVKINPAMLQYIPDEHKMLIYVILHYIKTCGFLNIFHIIY